MKYYRSKSFNNRNNPPPNVEEDDKTLELAAEDKNLKEDAIEFKDVVIKDKDDETTDEETLKKNEN